MMEAFQEGTVLDGVVSAGCCQCYYRKNRRMCCNVSCVHPIPFRSSLSHVQTRQWMEGARDSGANGLLTGGPQFRRPTMNRNPGIRMLNSNATKGIVGWSSRKPQADNRSTEPRVNLFFSPEPAECSLTGLRGSGLAKVGNASAEDRSVRWCVVVAREPLRMDVHEEEAAAGAWQRRFAGSSRELPGGRCRDVKRISGLVHFPNCVP